MRWSLIAMLMLMSGFPAGVAQAATLTWSGGAGTWDTSDVGWTPAATSPWNSGNGGGNVATFGGTDAVTVSGTIYANGINFNGATTVSGGTIDLAGSDPTVTFSAVTPYGRLGSRLTGSAGLTIASNSLGTLSTGRVFYLEGDQSNTFGDLTIRNTNSTASQAYQFTRLEMANGAAAFSGDLFIEGGASTSNLCVAYLVTGSSIPTGAKVNLDSDNGYTRFVLGGYDAPGNSIEIGGLSSTGATVPLNSSVSAGYGTATHPVTTLTINTSDSGDAFTFAGQLNNNVITGITPLSVVKTGPGTQALSSIGNTLTGPIEVAGGTLTLSGRATTAANGIFNNATARTIDVNAGGTLRVTGGYAIQVGTGVIALHGGTLDIDVAEDDGGTAGNAVYVNTITMDTAPSLVKSTGGRSFRAGFFADGTYTVQASASGSTMEPAIYAGVSGGNDSVVFNVFRGSSAADLTVSGGILDIPGATGAQLVKNEAGILRLTATSGYTGTTSVNAGTLAVNGSIATSSGVSVASGATLGGSGLVSAVSGAGRIAPGNSAGILTASSVDPTLGTGFAFEFGATGSPDYADATASVNDVLHLTGGTPLSSSLTGSNAIDVFFNVTTLGSGDTFRGGAYIDANVDFLAQVENASYAYYVLGDGNGPTNGYYTLADFDASLSITLSTVNDQAAFSGGSQDGRVMEFVVVPEPSTLALMAGSLLAAGTLARRRRAA